MLTPCIDDPNRKEQLKVKKQDPAKFGASHAEMVKAQVKIEKAKAEKAGIQVTNG